MTIALIAALLPGMKVSGTVPVPGVAG